MSLHSCWVCQELRKRYGYKGCIKTDRLQESKDLIDRLLLEINSPRKDDYIMGKVFIVTEGLYSGYSIVGVFSTREKAEEITNRVGGDYNDIEEYEIDILKPFSGWHVVMDKEGNTEGISNRIYKSEIEYPQQLKIAWGYKSYKDMQRVEVLVGDYIKADSEQHAVKIVNEIRTQLLANNLWAGGWSSSPPPDSPST